MPTLRIIVDGDSNRVYQTGDKVTGRVSLIVEEQKEIESLEVIFAGSCVTKTSRSSPGHRSPDATSPRNSYEEKIRLFNREKQLVTLATLEANKYSWAFEFFFPEFTAQRYKRMVHGANYLREPHALPPSFHLRSSTPGGAAQISYFVQARLVLSGSKETKDCKYTLRYHPPPSIDMPRAVRVDATVLYGQVWKPSKEKEDSRFKKAFSAVSLNPAPRIVPTLHHPCQVAPGQHIPLLLNLLNTRDPGNEAERGCIIDSLSVTISTYTTTMCGNSSQYPEDIVSKHVTCIAKTNMNEPIPFNQTQTLTSNFRLIDDTECVPTFKTYTITRRYALNVSIDIKYNEQHFTIRSSTALKILPRIPREPLLEEGEDFDPLPRYTPREPSREFAPDYEAIASSPTLLSPVVSRSSSLFSGGSLPSTAASTPVREYEQPTYERAVV
ncbi:hypothetical protein BDW02DRAFT_283579 [Decorospora gaudefroyi]|uniref:Arrestin-like N-terminal domain-containing protein n=1 Tax=Decorospora gaudefroyi TaxID=184978 RepID=A0A6A5KHN7_9PLEO|nr:hypothetical protein BDW02DRAFT_283579 [Decorospora gaudefroyi]